MHSPALGFMAGMRLFTETVTPWTKESLWGNEQLGDQLEDMIKKLHFRVFWPTGSHSLCDESVG